MNRSPFGQHSLKITHFLSIIRIILIVPWFYYLTSPPMLLVIALVAVLSDGLDGLVARKLNQTSETGAIVDIVCDKLFLLSSIISLFVKKEFHLSMYLMVFSREILLFVIGLLCKLLSKDFVIKPRVISKTVTLLQFLLIIVLLIELPYENFMIGAIAFGGVLATGDYFIHNIKWHFKKPIIDC